MTLFNLVFIMNPSRLDAHVQVSSMFEHVAKDINKALRYAQNYSNYVWKESEKIMNKKDKAREDSTYNLATIVNKSLTAVTGTPMGVLWKKILNKSTLAVAIRDIYEAISSNNIANVRFMSNPPVRLSVQIPKPYFLSIPPDNDEESLPGLWITTANCLGEDGDDGVVLNKHFALLLLEDEAKVMKEIEADGGELATPLLEYLKITRPTLS